MDVGVVLARLGETSNGKSKDPGGLTTGTAHKATRCRL